MIVPLGEQRTRRLELHDGTVHFAERCEFFGQRQRIDDRSGARESVGRILDGRHRRRPGRGPVVRPAQDASTARNSRM